jgi:predicted dehydrogenase
MGAVLNVALIGMDSSHTNVFAMRMNDSNCPEDQRIPELRARSCLRFESPFQNEEGLDQRQEELESWGVHVTRDLEEALSGCDAIMLELNDPTMHLAYFEKVATLGKPVFLDKPLADTVENGRKIVELATKHQLRCWSSSSLRFVNSLVAARKDVPGPELCNVYGPLGKAAAGSDIIWYGVHTVEMMTAVMGTGANLLFARRDEKGVVVTVNYEEDRRAVVELNDGAFFYGGRIQSPGKACSFAVDSSDTLYDNLLVQVRDFFVGGPSPVSLAETFEIQAILEAIEQSLRESREVPVQSF